MFVMFFSLSAMTNYAASARFGHLLIITIPLWDRQIRRAQDGTNLVGLRCISLSSLITVLIELAYAQLHRKDDLLHRTAERLAVVEERLVPMLRPVRSIKSRRTRSPAREDPMQRPCVYVSDTDQIPGLKVNHMTESACRTSGFPVSAAHLKKTADNIS
jgi:hypothetical protein